MKKAEKAALARREESFQEVLNELQFESDINVQSFLGSSKGRLAKAAFNAGFRCGVAIAMTAFIEIVIELSSEEGVA